SREEPLRAGRRRRVHFSFVNPVTPAEPSSEIRRHFLQVKSAAGDPRRAPLDPRGTQPHVRADRAGMAQVAREACGRRLAGLENWLALTNLPAALSACRSLSASRATSRARAAPSAPVGTNRPYCCADEYARLRYIHHWRSQGPRFLCGQLALRVAALDG